MRQDYTVTPRERHTDDEQGAAHAGYEEQGDSDGAVPILVGRDGDIVFWA